MGQGIAHTYRSESSKEKAFRRFHKSLDMPVISKVYFSGIWFFVGVHLFCAGFLEVEAVVSFAAVVVCFLAYLVTSASQQKRVLRVAKRTSVWRYVEKFGPFAHTLAVWHASRLSPDERKKKHIYRQWEQLCNIILVAGVVFSIKGVGKFLFKSVPLVQYLYYRFLE